LPLLSASSLPETEKWLLRGEYRDADYGTWTGAIFQGQPATDPGAGATEGLGVGTETVDRGVFIMYSNAYI